MSDEVIRTMDEGFTLLTQRMADGFAQVHASMDARFEEIDRRFEQVDMRLATIDRRLDQHDVRLSTIERRLAKVEERLDRVDDRFNKTDDRFDKLEKSVTRLGVLVERNSDDIRFLAEKIGTIEASVDRRLTEFGQVLDNRLVPLEQTEREHSRLLEGRQ